ncbi:HAMP domain-containing histidine kinase [Hazenella sp. IB182353]|nr:HAMP domain-containing sensor histidine kinase [Polycladospora coralii]MBS7530938.1 HAMP domain-containing histidine kinase [Polycladospora coralii]
MSLRWKIIILQVINISFFVASLIVYIHFFVADQMHRDVETLRNRTQTYQAQIISKLESLYPNQTSMFDFLEQEANRTQSKIRLQDESGNIVFEVDKTLDVPVQVWANEGKDFVKLSDQKYYLIYFQTPINRGEVLDLFDNLFNFAIVVMIFTVVMMALFIQKVIIKPITDLSKALEKVNHQNELVELDYVTNDEVGDLYRTYIDMSKRLQESHKQQSEMIASISHDFKTPLTSIMGFLERLDKSHLSEQKRKEYIQIIYRKAEDIERLTREFSLYYQDELAIESKTEAEVHTFFTSICHEYRAELDSFQGNLVYRNQVSPQAMIRMDEKRIRRVFANVISNAVFHVVPPFTIYLSCSEEQDAILFRVEDDGPGLPTPELASIFQPLYRVEKSRSRQIGGSGLGLSICKRIIENHGGHIEAYHSKHGGLGIQFTLPRCD